MLEGGAEKIEDLATTPILVSILETETEGVPEPPEPPLKYAPAYDSRMRLFHLTQILHNDATSPSIPLL